VVPDLTERVIAAHEDPPLRHAVVEVHREPIALRAAGGLELRDRAHRRFGPHTEFVWRVDVDRAHQMPPAQHLIGDLRLQVGGDRPLHPDRGLVDVGHLQIG